MEKILRRFDNLDLLQPRTFLTLALRGNLVPPHTEPISMLKKGCAGTHRDAIEDAHCIGGARFLHPPTDVLGDNIGVRGV